MKFGSYTALTKMRVSLRRKTRFIFLTMGWNIFFHYICPVEKVKGDFSKVSWFVSIRQIGPVFMAN